MSLAIAQSLILSSTPVMWNPPPVQHKQLLAPWVIPTKAATLENVPYLFSHFDWRFDNNTLIKLQAV